MFFPFWEWEGYINTKSQAININGIIKAEKEQKIYILKRTSIYFWMNSNPLLIMINFKIYKVHSQIDWDKLVKHQHLCVASSYNLLQKTKHMLNSRWQKVKLYSGTNQSLPVDELDS